MYIQKFNYHSLTRENVNGSRQYNTPDKSRVPSVTTILSATEPPEKKQALNEWRKRVGTEKAQSITTAAANRGTRMHSYLEKYVKEGNIGKCGSNPFAKQSYVMAEKIVENGLSQCQEFWGTEVSLFFPKIYAGTTDCVGVHDGKECIIDFKQTNKEKRREWIDDYFLQLLFYGTAHNELYNTNIKRGVIMMCIKPEMTDLGIITTEPKYQEFVIENDEWEHYEQKMWKRIEEYYIKFG